MAGESDAPQIVPPESWAQVEQLLWAAVELPPDERVAFLDRSCAGDPALRDEVESLLAVHERPGPLDRPPRTPNDESIVALSRPAPLSGRTISHYQVLDLLGGGGMGVVYRARDTRLARTVALKFLPAHLSGDPAAKERFLVEAQAAAALDHPNICAIHEIGETESGELFLAMPFYDGETLRRMLDRGALAVDDAIAIAVQIADGLERAHQNAVVHRDIKPANLLVTADGVVKILDFGVAKLADVSITAPGETPGTIAYMSPEQAEGADVDHRTDVWSLGVVLYEMLAGERPFRGASDRLVLEAIREAAPAPLSPLRADVTETLDGMVRKALAQRPADRYGTAGDLAADLRAIASGGAEAERLLQPAAERCRAVIVVSTLAGYAALVERLVPEEAERMAAGIRATALDIMTRHGGVVSRLDAEEMAFAFGVPATREDDAIRAVRAALELHAEVRRLTRTVHRAPSDEVALHTGIETGMVVAQPAVTGRREYSIAGSASRVAARLSMHAPVGEVWISASCHRLVDAYFEAEAREALPGRDQEHTLVPYRVLRESEAARRPAVTAFTGREPELGTLRRCFAEARAGGGRLVTVVGDAGMGKSRLLHEFCGDLDTSLVLLLQGRCQSYGGDAAYLPFIQMLTSWFGLAGIEDRMDRLHAVVAAVREIDEDLDEFIPLFLHLLSIASDEFPVPKHLHGDQFRLAMQDALAAIFTLAARKLPAVLLFEDWHWADEGSRAALRQLIEVIAEHSLLVVVSYRPGYGVAFDADVELTPVPLRPLDYGSSVAILRSLLKVYAFPDKLSQLLHERTLGNPFFLEEICHTLREDGTIRIEGAAAVLARPIDTVDLPDTVQAVIRARLDRLDRDARDVLRLAAVVGREFSRRLLEEALPNHGRIARSLEALKAAALVQQRSVAPEAAYRFKHVLTQEVAYASLLEHQRRQLHERVGDALERVHGENTENELDRLVHHFSRAEQWDRAVHYGLRWAERARDLAQFTEALRRLERTQRWLQDLANEEVHRSRSIEILLLQERLCETLGLRGRQQAIIDELVRVLDSERDRLRLAEVCVRQGDLFTLLRRFDDADAALASSLATYREMRDAVGERNTLRSLGLLRWHQGRNEEALEAIEHALAIDRERGDAEAIVGDLANLAPVLKSLGDLDRTRTCLEEALLLAEGGDAEASPNAMPNALHVKRSYILHHLANVQRELGDNQRALEYLHRADALSREKRLPIQASFHYTAIAHILLQEGRIEESLHYYREAAALTRRAKYVPGLAQALRILGNVLTDLGHPEEALPSLAEAAALFAQLQDHAAEAAMWSKVAEVHERASRYAEALAAWSKARTLRHQDHDVAREVEALEGIARVTHRHVAEPSLALGYLREGLALVGRLQDPVTEGRLRNSIANLEWEQGNYAEALLHYERALEIFRFLGDDVNGGLLLGSMGATLAAMGRRDEARARLEEAILLHRRTAQRQLEAYALGALGDVHFELGETDPAIRCFEDSLEIRRETGDRRGEAWMLHNLARAGVVRGADDQARSWLAMAEAIAGQIGNQEIVTACERLRREPLP
jgi:tetratricopeptide (TPR) repeat protein/class 3 adenylate cyclase